MSDRLYGGLRAGRTGLSLAVLLRRDDTGKGLTGVAPPGGVPALLNIAPQGDTGTSTPSVFTFTPAAGANYLLVRYAVRSGLGPATVVSIAAVPTGGGTTVTLTDLGTLLDAGNGVRLGLHGGAVLPGIEYTVTITWTGNNSNAAILASAYSGVGSAGASSGLAGGGAPTSITVATGGPSALVVDLCASPGNPSSMTPGGGQTAEAAQSNDGATQVSIRGSNKVGAGSVGMSWTTAGTGTGDVLGVALLGLTGTVMTATYARQGGAATAISLAALASPTAAWASGGWAEISATLMPGLYRLDVPDAALAVGADWALVEVVAAGAIEYTERLALETRRSLRRGVAYPGLTFLMQNASDGTALTGATLTGTRYLDGTPGAVAGAITEKSGGIYQVDLTAADTDAIFGLYLFTATGAVPRAVLLIFEP